MPESSAIAAVPVGGAAARALPSAFPAKVSASSGGSSTSAGSARSAIEPGPPDASSRSNSIRLCSLWVAQLAARPGHTLTRPAPAQGGWCLLDHRGLDRTQPLDAVGGECQQLVEMGPRQGRALGRGLNLHQPAVAGHHDVRVHFRGGVLGVVEVEQRLARPPCRTRSPPPSRSGAPLQLPFALQPRAGQGERHIGARDRGTAGAAVGLQDVAVEVDGAFPERPSRSRPRRERPIRRWISTVRPSGRPRSTSRWRRSPVEAGSIPYSAVSQPRPCPFIQRGTPPWAEAVQITRVSPTSISTDPVAVRMKSGWIAVGRICPASRS